MGVRTFPEVKVSTFRDHTDLLSRDDFQGLLPIKIDGQLDILHSIRTQHLEKQLDEIITMLDDELANWKSRRNSQHSRLITTSNDCWTPFSTIKNRGGVSPSQK